MNRRFAHLLTLSCLLAFLLCGLTPFSLKAQFYNGSQISFGKNRVQHQHFNWQFMRANQYDVYYYPTGRDLAQYVYYKTPQVIAEIEQLLQYSSKKKIQIIVYNTQADFRESNFAYDDDDFYNQGGVTNIYGTKIYLYFDGNHAHLDRMLRSGIMNIYAHWMVQGASVGKNMAYEYLMNIPSWYYSGLASYVGESWNSELDAYVKDGILSQRYVELEELSPRDATYAGHSFWKYVVDTYGRQTIARILYATRQTKSLKKGFYYGTGTPYRMLMLNWYKYYCVMYYQDTQKDKPQGEELIERPREKRDYGQLCFSHDGAYAFVTNEAGQIKVWLSSGDQDKPRCIFRRYQKTEDNPDFSFPLLAWHPQDSILGMTIEDKGHCYYYPYNVSERKWGKRFLVDVEKITSWHYSDDGKMMLFSGFKNGQSDIFIYSFLSRSFQNITNDFYDDYAPVFIDHQRQIVFSSNRSKDSILLKDDFREADAQSSYDLFLYSYAKKDSSLLRVSQTPYADEYAAQRVGDRQVVFLSDRDGVLNRYEAHFDSTISRIDTAIHYAYYAQFSPLTDGSFQILEHAYDPARQMMADIFQKQNVKRVFQSPLRLDVRKTPVSSPFHKSILLERQMREDFSFQRKDTLSDTLQMQEDSNQLVIPVGRGYRVQYSINKVITQADFSFLNTSYQQFEGGTSPIYLNTGFNALFMLGINDLFEDYRVTGGFRIGLDLGSYEFMLSYENLARRLDRQIVLYRQSISSSISDRVYKQRSNSVFYILKYPFDKCSSLRLTFKGRYEANVVAALSDQSLQEPETRHLWAGVKLEYVFDSSKELYTNLWRGTKLKIFGEYEQRAERETQNLFVAGIDVRHSFRLYRNMTFAVRGAASMNVGSARLVYFLGGVDNWINAKFDSDIWVDQQKNYAYQTLATNMRGFKQNIRNGTSFALLSAELRVPFVQLIAGHNLSFELLNSLQLNVFGDIGTAWTGLTPYSEDNCLYTRYIISGPISVMVKRQVDPFVGGFGLGLRCSLFGYFLRFDYAWGVEDLKISNKKGMFLFSIGTDF